MTIADVETLHTDVAIIGSGGAGLMCALHVAEREPGLDIAIVSKGAIGRSGCTRMVQGGYNAVLNPADSIDLHFFDTLKGGAFLNDQDLAWALVNDAPAVIHELETRVGCFFDRREDGHIHQKPFAGQSFDRTVHRGDLTGIEIMGRLRDQMFRIRPAEYEDVRALDLVMDRNGELAGITLLDIQTGAAAVLQARVIVMATGGSATMYRIAAPAREKTGDGVAMCLRAGLPVRDMEMLQFHPTGLLAGTSRLTGSVLEEGLRGAGAYLLNGLGERYMQHYDPVNLERATRDVVSRSGYMEIMAGRGTAAGGVLIDISHLGAEEVERRFPGMVARTRLIGRDLAREPVEVSPTAHFHMGGLVIDVDCQTELPGLLVAGEDSGGVHGANRLGGNGVAESTVFGARAGDTAARLATDRSLHTPDPEGVTRSLEHVYRPIQLSDGASPFDVTRQLKDLMWEDCGVVRTREGLERASDRLRSLTEQSEHIAASGPFAVNFAWQEALDVANQLEVARTIVESALIREESRGAHYRSDYPEPDDDTWLKSVVLRSRTDGDYDVELMPISMSRLRPGAQPPQSGAS